MCASWRSAGPGRDDVPSAPHQRCAAPGCPVLVHHGKCDAHRKQGQRLYDARRGTRQERGYDKVWYGWLRHQYLQGADLDLHSDAGAVALANRFRCETCGSKRNLHYDHKVPLDQGGERLDPANVRPLCASCHARREAIEHGFGRLK